MKILIWFLCLFTNALITTIINDSGVILGGLPTALMFGLTIWVARSLCKKWDEHKCANEMIEEIQKEANLRENQKNEKTLNSQQGISQLATSIEYKSVSESKETIIQKDNSPRAGIIRMIIGTVLIVLQVISIIGGAIKGKAFPEFYAQNGALFFYSLFTLFGFLSPSILGIILLISGYKAPEKEYKKMAKELREKAEKEKMQKDKKAISTQQNITTPSSLPEDKIALKRQGKKPFTKSVVLSIILSVVAIISIVLAINFQSSSREIYEDINPTTLYLILITAFVTYLISLIISKNNKCSKIHYCIVPVISILSIFALIEGSVFSTIKNRLTMYYNATIVNVFNIIWFTASLLILILYIPNLISKAKLYFIKLNRKQHSSITYKEKCYKKVERMQNFLEKGIITQEEFEENKREILKKIK